MAFRGHQTEGNTGVPGCPGRGTGTGLWDPWRVLSGTPTLTRLWKKLKPRNEAPEVGVGAGRPKLAIPEPAGPPQLAREGDKVQLGLGQGYPRGLCGPAHTRRSLSNSL